ncbi:hypothetical protein PTSG_10354 [Salpingoeca rosetta]|uniref:Uncharacterized protein n=1 Tax=Salpingoeca rosetta (strain ATCC 50818 / BSB-021) TaxID=946362 RepID=F2UR25_SALR5|nr:uncharacterized protein PTSG_10354 [Salpingoeca rosetta]EGD80080.1 hypothetical protein PTSG_10354 [Salpingoeca rosetta]|eukprot:XP_004988405.1 hypothetical protein PTSG_10354 [Salpingoeca rosetta]
MASRPPPLSLQGVSAAGLRKFFQELMDEFVDRDTDKLRALTTADTCNTVVLPRTKEKQCAFLELMDPEHIGTATVFVSHAWRYKIADVLATMVEFAEEEKRHGRPEPYFWFDLFMNNQNIAADLPQDWWSTTFKESIAAIGKVLLVLTPWSNPIPLTRAWCLWEIFCGISQEGVELAIRLPQHQHNALGQALLDDADAITNMLVEVQAGKAEAWKPEDKEMIFQAINSTVGFTQLNKAVKDQMRAWCLRVAQTFVTDMERKGATDTDSYALMCSRVGSVMTSFGASEAAIPLHETDLRVTLARHGPKHAGVGVAYNNLGTAHSGSGNLDKAAECFKKALAFDLAVHGHNHESTGITLNNLGNTLMQKGNYDEAIRYYAQSASMLASLSDSRARKHLAQALNNISQAYSKKGEYAQAIDFSHRVLQIRRATLGEQHPDVAASYVSLGTFYDAKADYDQALVYLHKALDIFSTILGASHPHTGSAFTQLGNTLVSKGQLLEAIKMYAAALQIHRKTRGEDDLSTAMCYNNIGTTLVKMGDPTRALEYFTNAVHIKERVLGTEHPETASSYFNLGSLCFQQGSVARAREHFNRALRIQQRALGEDHPSTAMTLDNLALVAAQRGDLAAAIAHTRRALHTYTRCMGSAHPYTQRAQRNLAEFAAMAQRAQGFGSQSSATVTATQNLLLRFLCAVAK